MAIGAEFIFLCVSIGFDVIVPQDWITGDDDGYLLEDGFKLLAIFVWSVYFCRAALEQILEVISVPIRLKS